MDIHEKLNEILASKGTIQFFENKYVPLITNQLVNETKEKSIKPIILDARELTSFSSHSLLKILLKQFKTGVLPLIDRAIWISQNDDLFWNLTLNELANIFDEVLITTKKQRFLVFVLLPNRIVQITEQLLSFLDEIISLPLLTEIQWCFISSSKELMVLLGLLTPEDYALNKPVIENHLYKGKYEYVMPEMKITRTIDPITTEPVTFDQCKVHVYAENNLLLQSDVLSPMHWIRITNSTKSAWKSRPYNELIDFIIYRTDSGRGCVLVNLLPNQSVTLISRDSTAQRIQHIEGTMLTHKTVLRTRLINEKLLFLEASLPRQCELEIQLSNRKLFVRLSSS